MEHRLLRYFVAVAEELHFAREATRLNIAQQPLSLAIKRLETQVGVTLLERTTRRVALTPAGAVYLREAREILRRTGEAAELARQAAGVGPSRLRIGYPGGTLRGLPQSTVRRFIDQFPDITPTLQVLPEPELERALVEGAVDVALVLLPVGDGRLRYRMLLTEPLVAVLPAGHPLAATTRIALTALRGEAFLLYSRRLKPNFSAAVLEVCQMEGFTPNITQEAATEEALVDAVAAGLGVSVVTAVQADMQRTRVDLVFRAFREDVHIKFAAAWRKSEGSAFVRAFVDLLAEDAQECRSGKAPSL